MYRLLYTYVLHWLNSLLASALVATSHVAYDVINKFYSAPFGHGPVEIAERFANSLNDIVFIDIICFHYVFCVRV